MKIHEKDFKKIVKKHKNRFENMKKLTGMLVGITLVLGLLIGGVVGGNLGNRQAKKELEKSKVEQEASKQSETTSLESKKKQPWNLTLVNKENPLAEGYVPELVEVGEGYSVDTRIAAELKEMLDAAKKEGLTMHMCSAYRSVEKQREIYNETMGGLIANGATYFEAFETASLSVAYPGTSEHELGMAVDIVSSQYQLLDEKQADTKEAKWLEKNSHKYGFVLRYPKDKIEETGISYEPWHYRYVGKEDAKKITQSKVTLEKYLEQN